MALEVDLEAIEARSGPTHSHPDMSIYLSSSSTTTLARAAGRRARSIQCSVLLVLRCERGIWFSDYLHRGTVKFPGVGGGVKNRCSGVLQSLRYACRCPDARQIKRGERTPATRLCGAGPTHSCASQPLGAGPLGKSRRRDARQREARRADCREEGGRRGAGRAASTLRQRG